MVASGAEKLRAHKPSARVMEEEEILIQALADREEDAWRMRVPTTVPLRLTWMRNISRFKA
jgi:hypothetical protein